MRWYVGLTVFLLGCPSNPPPLVPEPPPAPPVVVEEEQPVVPEEHIPKSIRRLVVEQREEVQSLSLLAAQLPDRSGRARAIREIGELATELSSIESTIARAGQDDSESLDDIALRLNRLATKTSLIHDTLRPAAL